MAVSCKEKGMSYQIQKSFSNMHANYNENQEIVDLCTLEVTSNPSGEAT